MAEPYTPSVDEVRAVWVDHRLDDVPPKYAVEMVPDEEARFDRMIAQVRAEAKAEALRHLADDWPDREDELNERADRIAGGAG